MFGKERVPGFSTSRKWGLLRFYRDRYRHLLPLLTRDDPALRRGHPLRIERHGARPVILKRYFRGGLVRFLGDRYLTSIPIRREIRVSEHLRARGVGAVEIVAAEARRSRWGWCRLSILSWEIPGVRRFSDLLRDVRGRERARILGSVAAAVRELHDAGVLHGDLNVDNILVGPDRVSFVDFDRSRILGSVPAALRARELRRLWRSARKRRLKVSRTDLHRFRAASDEGTRVNVPPSALGRPPETESSPSG